jgi:oligosaccharide repeat unit polymerase
VSLVGYFSIFAGGAIFRAYNYKTIINAIFISPLKNSLGFLFEKVVVNKTVTRFLFFIYLIVLSILLVIAFKAGSINDPRGYFYRNEGIGRALYNFTSTLSGAVSLLLIARIFQFNKVSDKLYFAFFLLFTIFIGSRSSALGPLLGFFTYLIYFDWKGRVKFRKLMLYAVVMITALVMIGLFRSRKIYSNTFDKTAIAAEFLYGNTFSDLRDFAWVLSSWNHQPFYGKTYASALISFVPTTYSSFRAKWGIGRVTARLGGFEPKFHPGLRPGSFGEPYLNFGIPGVIVIGILLGYIFRYTDHKIKYYAYTQNKIEVFKALIATALIGNLSITSGFFSIYSTICIFLFLYLFKLFLKEFE